MLAGGVGGARFLQGVRHFAHTDGRDDEVTAIINTGDDVTMHGLRITPDLDSVMYTLGGGIDTDRGWGRAGESWRIMDQLKAYGAEPTWFNLGDLDIATHLVRTQMLEAGYPLSDVVTALCAHWKPGVTLLPMTDQRCETHVIVELDDARKAIHFQEWWVRYRAQVPALGFVQIGLDEAVPAPGVTEAIDAADVVLIAPSNPVVSINTILNVPGIRDALRATTAPVIGLSPIIGGAAVRGMADSCLPVIRVETSAEGVGRLYGARTHDGVLDVWLVHDTDDATVDGVKVIARPLLMTDEAETAEMIRDGLSAVGVV